MSDSNRHAESSEPQLRLEMSSQARFLVAARAMIASTAQRLGFSEAHCGQISLALDEALCNIINHGYGKKPDGRIWINIHELPGDTPGMKIVIEDRAKQVDPAHIRSRDLDDIRPGGLGVYIIREVMDDVKYEKRPDGGMRLTLVKTAGNSEPDHSNEKANASASGREVKHEQR